jgi:hypothetical protein
MSAARTAKAPAPVRNPKADAEMVDGLMVVALGDAVYHFTQGDARLFSRRVRNAAIAAASAAKR